LISASVRDIRIRNVIFPVTLKLFIPYLSPNQHVNKQLLNESKKHMLFSNERRINRFDFKRNASKRVYIGYKL